MLLLGRCFGSATKDVREKIYKDHGSKTDSLKTEKIKQKQKQTGGGRRRPSEQRLQRQAAAPVSAERRGSADKGLVTKNATGCKPESTT